MAEASAAKPTEKKPEPAPAPVENAAKKPGKAKEMALVNFLLKYIKFVGIALAVWMMGWLGFSYVWVVSGLFVYVLWRMNQDEKKKRREAFKEAADHEVEAVEARMEDLPSWVRAKFVAVVLYFIYSSSVDQVLSILLFALLAMLCDFLDF